MAESFGARMRQRRERRQISLIAISEQTKIKLSLLDELERDDVSHWPSGIFRRAFIRAYAHAIDLEPDVIVREFLETYPDTAETIMPVPAVEAGSGGPDVRPGPPMRLRFLVGSAMDSVARTLSKKRDRLPGDVAASVEPAPVNPAPPFTPDLLAAAHLCTALGRIYDRQDAAPLLERAACLLDAVGLIVWAWDPQGLALVPALAHGYSDAVLAQLPTVRRDADNATAAAFRSAQTCIVKSSAAASGAVVVPMMTPAGCAGVFAVELQRGGEQHEPVRALATIFAAQIAILVGTPRLPQAVNA